MPQLVTDHQFKLFHRHVHRSGGSEESASPCRTESLGERCRPLALRCDGTSARSEETKACRSRSVLLKPTGLPLLLPSFSLCCPGCPHTLLAMPPQSPRAVTSTRTQAISKPDTHSCTKRLCQLISQQFRHADCRKSGFLVKQHSQIFSPLTPDLLSRPFSSVLMPWIPPLCDLDTE